MNKTEMPPKKTRNKKGRAKESDKGRERAEPYLDDITITADDEIGAKDFEFLSNAPVSEDDHFVFKSEKNWDIDTSKYSEFFTLDLKALSAAIESIPFNENVDIDKKYFTNDQLTSIYNTAERGKEKYSKIVSTSESEVVTADENTESRQQQETTDDIDFLLSLREPVNNESSSMTLKSLLPLSHQSTDSQIVNKPGASTIKPLDLEKWLDSVLDD